MKKLVYLLLLTTTIAFAQTSGITYQAVLYNPNGEELPGYDNIYSPLTDQQVCLRFSIIDQNGDLEYMEETTIMTDGFGMVNTVIGSHSQVDGYATGFNNIVWDGNPKSLKVDLDIKGQCTMFEELSNQPFTYVPFALYSANPGNPGPQGEPGLDGQDGVGIASTVDNNDGTFTINYTDGSSFTTADLTGPQGAQGIQGEQGPIGPTGATGPQGIQGPPGNDGADGLNGTDGVDGQNGVGIASTVDNNDGTFTINYTDGSSFTTADLTGPQGAQGIQGEQGPIGPTGLTGPQGVQGPPGNDGADGLNGTDGVDGQDGVGIASTVDNNDGTFTINYTDGSSFTTGDLTGPQGAQGIQGEQGPIGPTGLTGPQGVQGPPGNDGVDGLNGTDGVDGQDGVGIASTVDNNDGTFTINYTDGSSFTTADLTGPQGAQGIQGEQGPIGLTGATGPQGVQGPPGNDGTDGLNGTDGADGQDGVGIASTVDNNDGTFTINYTDGSSFTTADLTGPQGAQGEQGPIGPTGATGPQGVQGPPGNDGADGLNGQDGTDGQDGVGIASTVDNNDGTFTINYTDGSSFTTADLTGPQGEQGPVGPTGLSGPQGVQGPPGNDGADGLNGQDGADGLSAYDVWLSLGNTGTEQDFIDFLTGTNGKNTLIKNTDEPSGSNCTNGGVKIEVGLDINSNGILDTGEVDSSLTKYICNGVNGTNLYSSFNWQIPDGLSNNIIPVNYTIAPTSPAYTCCSTPPSGWFNQAYIVPSGYNLYITNIRFGLGYNHGSLGIRINNVLVNGAVCSFNSSTPRIVGENMIVSFSQNGYSSSPCSGPIFANFQGFLVPKSVTVIYQTTQFIVPSNYKFIKYDTSAPLPTIYYSNNIVPANTNGYLVEN